MANLRDYVKSDTAQKPKRLLDQARETMRLKRYSIRTATYWRNPLTPYT